MLSELPKGEKMRNIKLTIEYDGSRYDGWQRIGKGESNNTIENKLIEVIRKMTNENPDLICGARTEVGVHAYKQIANYSTKTDMKLYEIKYYFNRYLPRDIAVTNVEQVEERFHSSYNAKSKKYMYRIAIGDVPSVFDRKYTYYCFDKLDIDLMKEAANKLLGKHELKVLSSVKKSNKSTEREIYDIDIYKDNEEVQVTIHANDFLHNMARMIVSVLIDIGEGMKEPSYIDEIINNQKLDEEFEIVDAKGLFLLDILY